MLLGTAAPAPADPCAPTDLSALSEAELLDRVGEVATTMQRAGADLLRLAYEWAVAHPPERLDPKESAKPGRERAKLYGGDGTPYVTEFAAASFGARMGRGTHAGRRHLAAALDLKLRLPSTWARVQALEVRDTYAIHLAEATRTLTLAEAAWVDHEVHEQADGRITWTRFVTLVAGKVAQAAPHLAREREERAAKARFARKLKPLPGDEPAGMGTFMIRAPLPIIEALDAAITTLASRLHRTLPSTVTEAEDAPTTDDLRVQAVALLVAGYATRRAPHDDTDDSTRPSDAASDDDLATSPDSPDSPDLLDLPDLGELDLRDLLPKTTLVVHLYGGTVLTDPETGEQVTVPAGRDHDEHGRPLDHIARIDGHGPVTETWMREVLGPHTHIEVLPVLDIDGLAPVDGYEIPSRHRRAVQLRHPVETFPHGNATGNHTQLDHEIPWDHGPGAPPGQTRVDNLGPLSSFHHRLKTHGHWDVAEPFPGIHLWRDPHGHTYLRDATGTRDITRPGGSSTSALVVTVIENPDIDLEIDLDPAHRWAA